VRGQDERIQRLKAEITLVAPVLREHCANLEGSYENAVAYPSEPGRDNFGLYEEAIEQCREAMSINLGTDEGGAPGGHQ
jgi:hypothetical protein